MTDDDCRKIAYQISVLQHADFAGSWTGWRMRSTWLISPIGERVQAGRLAGWLTFEDRRRKMDLRKNGPQGRILAFGLECERRIRQPVSIESALRPRREASP